MKQLNEENLDLRFDTEAHAKRNRSKDLDLIDYKLRVPLDGKKRFAKGKRDFPSLRSSL